MSTKDTRYYKKPVYNKWNSSKFIIPAAIVLVVVAISVCILAFCVKLTKVDVRFTKNASIASGNDFVKCIEASSRTGEKYKYTLSGNITLTQENVNDILNIKNRGSSNESGAWFYGDLDGNNNVISFENGVVLNSPLLDSIDANSRVANLVFENCAFTVEAAGTELAVLTRINYGTIENVIVNELAISVKSLGNTVSNIGGIVVYNYGTINKVAVDAQFNVPEVFTGTDKTSEINEWNCRFGAIAAVNGGEGKISRAVVKVNFKDDFVVLTLAPYHGEDAVNKCVGYVVGAWNETSAQPFEAVYVINADNELWIYDKPCYSALLPEEVLGKVQVSGWSWNSDAAVNDGFPYFKTKDFTTEEQGNE